MRINGDLDDSHVVGHIDGGEEAFDVAVCGIFTCMVCNAWLRGAHFSLDSPLAVVVKECLTGKLSEAQHDLQVFGE